MHCGVEVTESSTNKQHQLSLSLTHTHTYTYTQTPSTKRANAMISNPEKTHTVPAEPESNRTTNTSQGNGSYTPPRSRHSSQHGDRASEGEFVGPPLKYDTIDATAPPPRDYEQRLQVRVIEAHHVPSAHRYGRQAAPFVTLHFQLGPSAPAMAVRTESIGSTLAPRYGDSFIFGFDAALEPKAVILVALEDRHASIIDETMGQSVRIPLSLLQQRQSKSLEGWFDLSTHNIEHGRTLRLTESLAHNSEVSQVRMLISLLPPLACRFVYASCSTWRGSPDVSWGGAGGTHVSRFCAGSTTCRQPSMLDGERGQEGNY